MSTKTETQLIHKGWDTLPPLIPPEKANVQPNQTMHQIKCEDFKESYQKACELQEPKTFIIERITF
jgi:hypothetical protein